jgi:hypothetical protein
VLLVLDDATVALNEVVIVAPVLDMDDAGAAEDANVVVSLSPDPPAFDLQIFVVEKETDGVPAAEKVVAAAAAAPPTPSVAVQGLGGSGCMI